MSELLKTVLPSFKYEFIEAVDGRGLSDAAAKDAVDEARMNKVFKRELTRGEIGCLLSHKKAYQTLLDGPHEAALILEDDAFFDSHLAEFLGHLDELPKDLELLLIGHQRQVYNDDGYRIESPFSRRFSQTIGGVILRRLVGKGNGGYGYLITKKGAKRLQDATQKAFMPIDNYTCNEDFINIYALFPPLIETRSEYIKESSTQEISLKKRSLFKKRFKKFMTFLKFYPKSLKRLKKYE